MTRSPSLLDTRRASTDDLPVDQRVAFWEQYNASTLVGLKCSSFSETGFNAREDNLSLERLRVAHIVGNQHVIERDGSMIRTVPKESIFVSLVIGSESFFFQNGTCHLLEPGELMVYRTDKPYLFGFSSSMHKFIFDIPQDVFASHCLRHFDGALKISAHTGTQRLLLRTLSERTGSFFEQPLSQGADSYQDDALELLGSIIAGQVDNRRINALSASYLLAAKQCILEQLADPTLSCERVAAQTGISTRHLARLFALEDTQPHRFILEKRLQRAFQVLSREESRGLDIAEIAYQQGFSSQAHFARAFKAHYGRTPSEVRATAGGA
ncbi:helix-turn-helix domain-containing protein [Pseudomonas alvandae]|uniref:helix-turn-helix domain-containing protein n=1 Tax=Pseudomonas canavaninivorans TaxID=2842348 RepID=UPI00215DF7F0|nr:helix-turn-helix domain-containing protein [Pseudomonas canavaninivorans]UVM70401.1 helix-turn-helix domain-containing protein [Pseudomonas canavaninivorans]